jgi:hypothetical protein
MPPPRGFPRMAFAPGCSAKRLWSPAPHPTQRSGAAGFLPWAIRSHTETETDGRIGARPLLLPRVNRRLLAARATPAHRRAAAIFLAKGGIMTLRMFNPTDPRAQAGGKGRFKGFT